MLAQGVRGKSGGGAAKPGSAAGGRYPSYATESEGYFPASNSISMFFQVGPTYFPWFNFITRKLLIWLNKKEPFVC